MPVKLGVIQSESPIDTIEPQQLNAISKEKGPKEVKIINTEKSNLTS